MCKILCSVWKAICTRLNKPVTHYEMANIYVYISIQNKLTKVTYCHAVL